MCWPVRLSDRMGFPAQSHARGRVQQRSGTPGCLDDETLAAYVDGGLTAEERSQVELHLAACRDCFALFTESVKTVQAMRDEADDVVDVPSGAASEVSVSHVDTPAVVVPMPPRRGAFAAAGDG